MRILFISNEFPSPIDPTKAVFNLRLMAALAHGHELRVISPVAWTEEWRARRRTGACLNERNRWVGRIPVFHPRYYYTPGMLRSQYGRFFWHSIRATVLQSLREQPPDLVLGYWAHPDGEAAVRAARIAGCPAAVLVGGSDVLLLTRDGRRRRRILSVLHAADAVLTTSDHLRTALLGRGIDPSKVSVVHRGVDTNHFKPGDKAEARQRLGLPDIRTLIWVGRMVHVKGLDVLLEAAVRLRGQIGGFRLYLIGDGELKASLQAAVVANRLQDCIHFAGSVAHEDLPDWYRAADLTVLPSRSEGVPNVLRESLACGTPFVASNVGGISELGAGHGSVLIPPENPSLLAEAIVNLLNCPRPSPVIAPPTGWEQSAETLLRVVRPLVAAAARPEFTTECASVSEALP